MFSLSLKSCKWSHMLHPCADHLQGYILYSYRKKLKAELVGRSQDEIRQLRQAGQEVTDTYQVRRGSGWSPYLLVGGVQRSVV